jgi:hypothetical protein
LEAEFSLECDEKGFSINCNITKARDSFEDRMIPAILLHYTRQMCKELGLDFGKALKASLGVVDEQLTMHRGPVGEA